MSLLKRQQFLFFQIFFSLQSRFTFFLRTRLNRFNHKNNYNMHEHEKNLNLHINKFFEIEVLELFFENFTTFTR